MTLWNLLDKPIRNKGLLALLIASGLLIISLLGLATISQSWRLQESQKLLTNYISELEYRISAVTEVDKVTWTVRKLHQYHQVKDQEAVFTLFTEPKTEEEKRSYDFNAPSRLWIAATAGGLEVLKSYKIIDTKIDNDKATVRVYREIISKSPTDETPDREWTQTTTITLVKRGNKWLIDQCGERKYACLLGIE